MSNINKIAITLVLTLHLHLSAQADEKSYSPSLSNVNDPIVIKNEVCQPKIAVNQNQIFKYGDWEKLSIPTEKIKVFSGTPIAFESIYWNCIKDKVNN